MAMDSIFKVSLVLDLIDRISGKTGGVNSAVGSMTHSFELMQKSGAALAGVGTGIVGACTGAVTATFETQNALGEIASLGVKDLKAVEDAAKGFSDTWAGTTKADFISASYDIKSGIASLSDEGIAKFTELAALTGKATKSTTDTMGSLFATGYGIYKGYYSELSDLEFGEMFSAGIATAVKNYKTSGTEMASAISALGATATNANVSMEEQLAILGQLQTTMSGSEAATKYRAFLNAAANAGEKLGLTFTDSNNQLLSTPEILETLKGKYGDTIDAVEKQKLKEAFGTDEAVAMIDLLYKNTDQLKTGIDDLHDSMSGGVAVTEQMATAINNTPEQKFEVVKQKIHNTAEELGKSLLPSVNSAMDVIAGVIQRGSDWVAANEGTVASIMHIVMYLGIFLIASGALIAVVGTVGKTFTGLGGILKTVQKVFGGGGFLSALGPFALIAVAVGGLVALFKACGGDVSKLQGIFSNVFGFLGNIVSDALKAVGTYLPGFLQFGFDLLMSIAGGILNALPNLMVSGAGMVVSLLNGISQMLPGIADSASGMVNSFLDMIVAALPGILTSGVQMVTMVLQGIIQALPAVVQAGIQLVLSLLGGLVQNLPAVASAGIGMIGSLIQGIGQVLPTLLSAGLTIIGNILSGILQAVPTLLGMIPDLFSAIGTAIMEIDWAEVGSNLINGIKDGFMQGFQNMMDSVKGAWSKFKDWIGGGGDEEIPETVETSVPDAQPGVPKTATPYSIPQVPEAAPAEVPEVTFDVSKYQIGGMESMAAFSEGIKAGGVDVQSAMGDMAGMSMDGIMASFTDVDLSGAATAGNSIMESIGAGMSQNAAGTVSEAQDAISRAMGSATPKMPVDTGSVSELQSAWTSGMASIQRSVSAGMASVKATVASGASQAAAAVKSAFAGISVTVPAPKLPHVSVSYSTVGSGDVAAKVPNFGISYYAEGGVMTRPTLFGFQNGNGMVGGEAGDEAILPLSTLWGRMKEVVTNVVQSHGRKDTKAARQASSGIERNPNGKGGTTYNNYEVHMNIDIESVDALKKLKRLLDELDTAEDGEPAMA